MATRMTAVWSKDGKTVKLERNADGRIWTRQVAAHGELTAQEAAALAGVTIQTVLRWITAGELQPRNRKEKTLTVRASDVRTLVSERGLL